MTDKEEVLDPSEQGQQKNSTENLQRNKTVDKQDKRHLRDRQRTSKRRSTESLSEREKRLQQNREYKARRRSKIDVKDAILRAEYDITSTRDHGDKPMEINELDSIVQMAMSTSTHETHGHQMLGSSTGSQVCMKLPLID